MHIADGILSAPVLAAGMGIAAAGTGIGLRRIDDAAIPRAAVLSAALFVASLIHVPVGPVSVHLVLNGLAGLVLGWAAFPAILCALLLQSLFFGHGGILVLGVNATVMACPAVLAHYLFRGWTRHTRRAFAAGACAAALAVAGSALLAALALSIADRAYAPAAGGFLIAQAPLAIAEALVTGAAASLLCQVRPEVFSALHAQPRPDRAYV